MIDVSKFINDGWVVSDIPDPYIIHSVINSLELHAGSKLEYIHDNFDDEKTKNLQIDLSQYFWKEEFSLPLASALKPLMHQLIGLDLMVQYHPYLRIARPHKPQDNFGFHKDTHYGQTPYELAVHIPFVDLDEHSALRIISGSHRMKEGDFVIKEGIRSNVLKGSIENHTGRPYAPKPLLVPDTMQTEPMCVKVGQCAIFSPALFHGQTVNYGNITRVSCDFRFVSKRAPGNWKIGKAHAQYIQIEKSPVEQMADEYYDKNM